MKKNSAAPLRHALRPALGRALFVVIFAVLGTFAGLHDSLAMNACSSGGSGIGGTGAPQAHNGSGIGGTGAVAESSGSGIGGTGAPQEHSGSGIGGTGAVAEGNGSGSGIGGTGIVGTITGFGSVCVNGLEVQYDRDTPTQFDGKRGSARQLAVGQVVAILARGAGSNLRAHNIRVEYAVSGPVGRIDRRRSRIEVLGQAVSVRALPQLWARLRPGAYVAVSGLRDSDGVIVATRVQASPRRELVSVAGPVTAVSGNQLRIHGLPVSAASGISLSGIRIGRTVRVSGRLSNGRLLAARIQTIAPIPFHGQARHFSLEGYVHGPASGGRIQIGTATIGISEATRFLHGGMRSLRRDQRVHVQAHIDGAQAIVADRIEFEPTHFWKDYSFTPSANGRRRGDDGAQRDAPRGESEAGATIGEKPEVERPSIERPSIEVPEIERPEIERPEITRPEIERPEVE